MTEAIEQLASKLSVENSEIEDFLKKLSIRFDQPVTAETVLELTTFKENFTFDTISQHVEQRLIYNYIRENVNLLNKETLQLQNYIHNIISYKDIKFIYPKIEIQITKPILDIKHLEIMIIIYKSELNIKIINYINNFGYGLKKFGYINNFTNLIMRMYKLNLHNKLDYIKKINHKYFIHLDKILNTLSNYDLTTNIDNIFNLLFYIQNNKLNIPNSINPKLFSSSNIDINRLLTLSLNYNDKQFFINSIVNISNKYIGVYNKNDLYYLLLLEIKLPLFTQNYDLTKAKGLISLNEIYNEYRDNDYKTFSIVNFIEIKIFIIENINLFPKSTRNESRFLILNKSSKSIYNMIYFLKLSLNKKVFIENIEFYMNLLFRINKLSINSINKLISIESYAIINKINLDNTYKKLLDMNIENHTENQIIKIITAKTIRDIPNTINQIQNINIDNINLFKSRKNLYYKIANLSNKDIYEIHTFLNKNRSITDEHLKDTINYLSKRNTVQTYIFEYIQLVPELRKVQSPIKHPDDLIDDILFKTGLRVNAQKLLSIIKSYDTRFHLLEYCSIYTYTKEALPNIENISQFLNSIKPMTFVEFQQRLSFITNPSITTVDGLILMFNSITNDLLPRNIMNYNHQLLNGDTLTHLMTSLWNPNIHHKSHIQTVIKGLWDDICSEQRMYEIPSEGRAEIEAPALLTKYTNILSFKFVQEGLEAPSIYVLALFSSNGDKPLAGTITVNSDGSIKGFVDLINNKTYYLLIQYMIIANYHALVIPHHNEYPVRHHQQANYRPRINHEITMPQQRQIPRVRQASITSSLNDWYEAQSKAIHAVVGHERFISKTFRAAQIKYLQAAKAGITLKPGHTWVQGHARGDATFTHGTITLDGDDLLKPTIFKAPEHIQNDLSKYFNI
ncbi:hypothetical protein [Herpetosiphon sp. NSE202]|uniref:hypothetical protein n=1 Tax=Herpetosiphon sp. NSE202 TaxID=3351349 RepID=UPI0036373BB7